MCRIESADERSLVHATHYLRFMPNAEVVIVPTGAGMLALWRGTAFAEVDGYDAWERHVHNRLADAIESGEIVPIGIQGDGAFGVRVAAAPGAPTDRERRYCVVTSEPYLLVSDGGSVFLSGLEAVGDAPSSPIRLSLPAGPYAVRTLLVAWDDEPGARNPDGSPGPDALADFVVWVYPMAGGETFRTSEATFDPVGETP